MSILCSRYFRHRKKNHCCISELDVLVSQVHMECVGESRSVLSTLDKLKRVELKMELLTRDLEQMPREKVAIAQKVGKSFENVYNFAAVFDQSRTFAYRLAKMGCIGILVVDNCLPKCQISAISACHYYFGRFRNSRYSAGTDYRSYTTWRDFQMPYLRTVRILDSEFATKILTSSVELMGYYDEMGFGIVV